MRISEDNIDEMLRRAKEPLTKDQEKMSATVVAVLGTMPLVMEGVGIEPSKIAAVSERMFDLFVRTLAQIGLVNVSHDIFRNSRMLAKICEEVDIFKDDGRIYPDFDIEDLFRGGGSR